MDKAPAWRKPFRKGKPKGIKRMTAVSALLSSNKQNPLSTMYGELGSHTASCICPDMPGHAPQSSYMQTILHLRVCELFAIVWLDVSVTCICLKGSGESQNPHQMLCISGPDHEGKQTMLANPLGKSLAAEQGRTQQSTQAIPCKRHVDDGMLGQHISAY